MEAEAEGKKLGRWAAQSIVAGSMLGIGIFIAPPVVAQHVQSSGYFLLMWLLGGLAALCGALSVAELGAMMPRAGGEYPYLRLAYGPGIAFATGWLQLLATFPGSLAAMAVGTATYQMPVLFGPYFAEPVNLGLMTVEGPSFWAITIVVVLTALNHIGVVLSGRVQLVLTVVPLAVLLLVSLFVVGDVGTVQVGGGGQSERGLRLAVRGQHQFVLGRVVGVGGAGGHIGLAGDRAHGSSVKAMLCHKFSQGCADGSSAVGPSSCHVPAEGCTSSATPVSRSDTSQSFAIARDIPNRRRIGWAQ